MKYIVYIYIIIHWNSEGRKVNLWRDILKFVALISSVSEIIFEFK